jgi:hypothetical protein
VRIPVETAAAVNAAARFAVYCAMSISGGRQGRGADGKQWRQGLCMGCRYVYPGESRTSCDFNTDWKLRRSTVYVPSCEVSWDAQCPMLTSFKAHVMNLANTPWLYDCVTDLANMRALTEATRMRFVNAKHTMMIWQGNDSTVRHVRLKQHRNMVYTACRLQLWADQPASLLKSVEYAKSTAYPPIRAQQKPFYRTRCRNQGQGPFRPCHAPITKSVF